MLSKGGRTNRAGTASLWGGREVPGRETKKKGGLPPVLGEPYMRSIAVSLGSQLIQEHYNITAQSVKASRRDRVPGKRV